MDLDEIKLKEPSDLSSEEKDFLRENEDKLTDLDKDDYKDILAEKKEEEVKEEVKKEEDDKTITFKTQEELDTYIEKRKVQEKKARLQKKEEKKFEKGRYFPKGYEPKDWNDFVKDLFPLIRKDRESYTRQQRERMAEINNQLDAETEALRKIDPEIPGKGTSERREFDRQVAEVMLRDRNVTNVTQAYAALKDRGGKKKVSSEKKDIASKVSGGKGTAEETKSVKYEKYASRDLDDAEEAALKKWKTLS